jgi:mono/diheme cytochrome c family protein
MKIILSALYVGCISISLLLDQDEKSSSIARGKSVYMDFCITCHMGNGEGVPKVFPPLAKSDYLIRNREESIRSVKYGQKGEITVNGIKYSGLMPSPGLSSEEVADVMNYIYNNWGNKNEKLVTVSEVESINQIPK